MDVIMLTKAAFAAILLLAALSDARRFLIPNIYSVLMILLFVAAWFLGFPFAAPLWSHLLHFALALGIGMALFHFGWLGGGDVKLYASTALWFAFGNGILLFFVTTISGAAIVIVSMSVRMLGLAVGRGDGEKGRLFKRRIAYGVAIAVGGIASLWWIYPASAIARSFTAP